MVYWMKYTLDKKKSKFNAWNISSWNIESIGGSHSKSVDTAPSYILLKISKKIELWKFIRNKYANLKKNATNSNVRKVKCGTPLPISDICTKFKVDPSNMREYCIVDSIHYTLLQLTWAGLKWKFNICIVCEFNVNFSCKLPVLLMINTILLWSTYSALVWRRHRSTFIYSSLFPQSLGQVLYRLHKKSHKGTYLQQVY